MPWPDHEPDRPGSFARRGSGDNRAQRRVRIYPSRFADDSRRQRPCDDHARTWYHTGHGRSPEPNILLRRRRRPTRRRNRASHFHQGMIRPGTVGRSHARMDEPGGLTLATRSGMSLRTGLASVTTSRDDPTRTAAPPPAPDSALPTCREAAIGRTDSIDRSPRQSAASGSACLTRALSELQGRPVPRPGRLPA